MDSTVLHLRLDTTECETLDGLAGKALNRQAVARMLLIAAIEAVQGNGNMVNLPPKFSVSDCTKKEVGQSRTIGAKPSEGTVRTTEGMERFDAAVNALVGGSEKPDPKPKAKHPEKVPGRKGKASGILPPSGPASS